MYNLFLEYFKLFGGFWVCNDAPNVRWQLSPMIIMFCNHVQPPSAHKGQNGWHNMTQLLYHVSTFLNDPDFIIHAVWWTCQMMLNVRH